MHLYYSQKDEDRFWAKVEVTDDCWYWTAGTDQHGYGKFGVGGESIRAHRFAYLLVHGNIPDGMFVCHTCDTPPCVRPDHMFLGTNADNSADRAAKGRARGSRSTKPSFVGAIRTLLTRVRRPKPTREELFWAKVERTDSCWLWTGYINPHGYGQFGIDGHKLIQAHVYAYELVHGPIPAGYDVCHSCDVRQCVNPDHLWLGTRKENMQDAVRKGRMPKGERRTQTKLTENDVRAIRRRYTQDNMSQRALAREYGVSQGTISLIVLRKNWPHIE